MTLDAMHWVWKHSQSKGNARLALLSVADQVRTSACEVRLSYADLMSALNAGRPAVRDALRAAEKLGELEVVEAGKGTRASLYRLPKAVDYVRPTPSSGSNIKPLGASEDRSSGSNFKPLEDESASASGSNLEPQGAASGLKSVASGSNFKPHHQTHNYNPQSTEGRAGGRRDALREAQPLIDAMTEAGIVVSWTMRTDEWRDLLDLIDRVDIAILVQRARDARRPGQQVQYATWFLRGTWRGLPTTKGRAPSSRDSPPRQTGPHCGDIDCHPDTRLREVEDEQGLPVLIPCSICHPATQGARK
ncbi:hypothetical protein ACFWPQ_02025 [Streptomyces sp. NPDC058464]|uniref:hypothetical protein n=1 Tax=Streptomyces sp. NPDC058464 TaxID=3346511 RepID=UPI003666310F